MATYQCNFCKTNHDDRNEALVCCTETDEYTAYKCPHCETVYSTDGEALECCASPTLIHNIEDYRPVLMQLWTAEHFQLTGEDRITNVADNEFTFLLPFFISKSVFEAWCSCNQIHFCSPVVQGFYDVGSRYLNFNFRTGMRTDKVVIQMQLIADFLSAGAISLNAQDHFLLKVKDGTYSNVNTNIELALWDFAISDNIQIDKSIKKILQTEAHQIKFNVLSGVGGDSISVFDKYGSQLLYINPVAEVVSVYLDPRYNIALAN